jgi:hypothetical protein
MKPTAEHFTGAVQEFAAVPYFPSETGARIAITKQLALFVDDVTKLRWLVDTVLSRADVWPGIAGLRALYCTRWRAADGIDGGTCLIPGFTPDDNEGSRAQVAASRGYLPAPDDSVISDEERQQIDALARRISLRAAEERARNPVSSGARSRVRTPEWLMDLTWNQRRDGRKT